MKRATIGTAGTAGTRGGATGSFFGAATLFAVIALAACDSEITGPDTSSPGEAVASDDPLPLSAGPPRS